MVASMIRLGNCLDLLDPENARALRDFHDELDRTVTAVGGQLPKNHNTRKYRDCYVLEAYYAHCAERGQPMDSARGVYVPTPGAAGEAGGGYRLWERSWLTLDAHLQICIRPESASSCILGTWPVGVA